MIVPAWVAFSNTFRDCRITLICCAVSYGRPRVWAKGNSTAKVRGVPTRSAQNGIMVTKIVEKPKASKIRANPGTFMAQSGQLGVRKTQSTTCSLSF